MRNQKTYNTTKYTAWLLTKKQYDKQQQTSATQQQGTDLGHVHTEFGGVNIFEGA